MGLYDSDFTAASVFFLEAYGQSITYTPKYGDAVGCTAVVGDEQVSWIEEQDRTVKRRQRSVMLSTDADGDYGGVESPTLKAIVTIDSEEWNIDSIKPLGEAYVDITCVRLELDHRAPATHRGT